MIQFPSLLPKENKFCVLLEQLSGQAHACALHLKIFVESSDAAEQAHASQAITACKATAKSISAEITTELCRTFITPFDREDIQDFSTDLYKIPKIMEKVRNRLAMHGLSSIKGDFSRQIDLIVQEAEAMEDMVRELTKGHNDKRIIEKAAVLQELENRGDDILGDLLVSLFKTDYEARDLILRKDIYDMLEKVIDRYRDAASVALQIVLKHS
jgi:uncharacterized protein Yka (UPF0111/DUF47 family)